MATRPTDHARGLHDASTKTCIMCADLILRAAVEAERGRLTALGPCGKHPVACYEETVDAEGGAEVRIICLACEQEAEAVRKFACPFCSKHATPDPECRICNWNVQMSEGLFVSAGASHVSSHRRKK